MCKLAAVMVHCIKRSIHEGRFMYLVCAVLHHLEGGITSVLIFLRFATGFQSFSVLANGIGVKSEDKK